MREVKVIKCSGDMLLGNIFEEVEKTDKEELYHLRFKIEEMTGGGAVKGGEVTRKVRLRYSLDQLRELRDDLNTVIDRMEKEL